MEPIHKTPTPDLDAMLMRAGWPVADSPEVQQIQAMQRQEALRAVQLKFANALASLAAWLEHHATKIDTTASKNS